MEWKGSFQKAAERQGGIVVQFTVQHYLLCASEKEKSNSREVKVELLKANEHTSLLKFIERKKDNVKTTDDCNAIINYLHVNRVKNFRRGHDELHREYSGAYEERLRLEIRYEGLQKKVSELVLTELSLQCQTNTLKKEIEESEIDWGVNLCRFIVQMFENVPKP